MKKETEYSKQFGRVRESDLPKSERHGRTRRKSQKRSGQKFGPRQKLGPILEEALAGNR